MSAQPLAFHPNQAAVKSINADKWPVDDIVALLELPFNDLLFRAQLVHREHFDPAPKLSWQCYCQSRPVGARKIVRIVRKLRATILG